VVTFNKLAEQCNQFLAKGRLVYAEGRLRTRTWEGQDGLQHSRVEVNANRVVFLDRRGASPLPEERSGEGAGGGKMEESDTADLEPGDITF
jgi:single-strand DNA-binding protein